MKEDNIKIIQIVVEPYKYYTSNGSMYKDTTQSHHIFGLGDDGKIYQYKLHKFWHDDVYGNKEIVGWKLYVPN